MIRRIASDLFSLSPPPSKRGRPSPPACPRKGPRSPTGPRRRVGREVSWVTSELPPISRLLPGSGRLLPAGTCPANNGRTCRRPAPRTCNSNADCAQGGVCCQGCGTNKVCMRAVLTCSDTTCASGRTCAMVHPICDHFNAPCYFKPTCLPAGRQSAAAGSSARTVLGTLSEGFRLISFLRRTLRPPSPLNLPFGDATSDMSAGGDLSAGDDMSAGGDLHLRPVPDCIAVSPHKKA
ncbi:unnamed protein product [Darwinula stevensoni]|uniref:WAP domain-containing protein n=1 Tax=Darwinula stevensoni TaxID=69355 RepID=A0A7R9A6B9_9CRUS|nr:unnamed protein product [Darwinula stevensoni]CAG0888671.1 unnamed protein product [Darwinula stevensoni]